ncbi:MAG: bacteriocin [Treponema sp.]|nr:bacteriocin [Candidatus Treponema merdequi]
MEKELNTKELNNVVGGNEIIFNSQSIVAETIEGGIINNHSELHFPEGHPDFINPLRPKKK